MSDPFERETCPRSQLKVPSTALGKGAVGAVYPLLDDARWVYKEFSPETLTDPRFEPDALIRAIRWRRGLRHDERELVSQTLCWPRTAVVHQHRVIGVVMPRIPSRFSLSLDGIARLRTLDHLFLHPKRIEPLGLSPLPLVARTALLYALARALSLMERHGVAHGDISPANVLYSVESRRPSIYIIDCDSVAVQGRGAFAVRGTPYWQDPRVAEKSVPEPDIDSDRYALGLAFYRIWNRTPGNITQQSRLTLTPPATAELAHLLRDTLRLTTPRPSAAGWASALGDYLRQQNNAAGPELAEAVERLSRDHQLIGTVDLNAADTGQALLPPSDAPPPASGGTSPASPPRAPAKTVPTAEGGTSTTPAGPPTCGNCGSPTGQGHRFCRKCGKPVETAPTTPPVVPAVACQTCGTPIPPGAAGCPNCSKHDASTTVNPAVCPTCGGPVPPGHQFCRFCGSRLAAP